MRVLVVDDQEMIRKLMQRVLSDYCVVNCAGSALEAVAKAKDGDYDFVLMDFNMPEHDGLWLMQNWKLPPKTKIILMTGYRSKELVEQMFALGVSSCLEKPFTPEDVLQQFEHLAKPLPVERLGATA